MYSKHKSVKWLEKPLTLPLNTSMSLLHANLLISSFTYFWNSVEKLNAKFGLSFVHKAHLKCNVQFMSIYGST